MEDEQQPSQQQPSQQQPSQQQPSQQQPSQQQPSQQQSLRTRVLIIGGGFAGLAVATKLPHKHFEITLVDPKDYFEMNFLTPRAIVDKKTADELLVFPFEGLKDHYDRFIQAKAVELKDDHAILSNGETVHFDYAVVASGSRYTDTAFKGEVESVQQRRQDMETLQEKIKNCKNIVVAGGHYVGCEIAAELAELPSKPEVTIVQSHCALMDASPAKTQLYVKNFMENKGIKVLLDHRLDMDDNGIYSHNGKPLDPQPDHVFWATGMKTCTEFVAKGLGDDVLTKGNAVKVDEYFRIIGHPKIFALGDTCDVKEYKLAYLAEKHGFLTARNLVALNKGREQDMVPWKPFNGMPLFILSLGKKKSVTVIKEKIHTTLVPNSFGGMAAKASHVEKDLKL